MANKYTIYRDGRLWKVVEMANPHNVVARGLTGEAAPREVRRTEPAGQVMAGFFSPRNKPSTAGSMSGRQAKGLTGAGRPNLCQSCLSRPARVSVRVKGRKFSVCHDCADDLD